MHPRDPRSSQFRPGLGGVVLHGAAPLLGIVALALVMDLLVAPLLPEAWYAKVLADIGINIVLAVSLNMVNGFTGQFSIGHAGFMAIGGYTAAAVVYYGSIALWGDAGFHGGYFSYCGLGHFNGPWFGGGDLLFVAACLIGGLVAAVVGVFVGLPSIRLRGDYLAIVTLGFGEIVRILIQQTPGVLPPESAATVPAPGRYLHLGGALGFTNHPFYTTIFWIWLAVGATVLVAWRLRNSTYGRAFLSIREDEIAAAAMGVPILLYKVMAFTFAAFFAGIAGGLFAHQLGSTLNPADLGFAKSFDILIMIVLGGLGSISGAILAAAGLTILPELLRNPPHVWPLLVPVVPIALALLLYRRRRLARGWGILAGGIVLLEIARDLAVAHGVQLSDYRMVFYALSLILVMILRPEGLLGTRELWELWPRKRKGGAGVRASS